MHPRLANVVAEKMPGRFLAPGSQAGRLTAAMAERFGLPAGIPVSAAIIDAHAGVPGAGAAEPGTLVMVMGTSSCHMLNAVVERPVMGVAGIVEGGILPGYFGYETGQAAVGDAFDWFRRLVNEPRHFDRLTQASPRIASRGRRRRLRRLVQRLPHAADGRLAEGRVRRPHAQSHGGPLVSGADGGVRVRGRWIVDLLRESGVPVTRFMATGGLPHHNPLLVQIYADVLGEPIGVHPSKHGPALGAAILGVLAAGAEASGFADSTQAIAAMAQPRATEGDRALRIVAPNSAATATYAANYARYFELAAALVGAKTIKEKLRQSLAPQGA